MAPQMSNTAVEIRPTNINWNSLFYEGECTLHTYTIAIALYGIPIKVFIMKIRTLSLALLLSMGTFFYSCGENTAVDNAADEVEYETENAMANMGAEVREESNEFERDFRDARMNIDNRMTEMEAEMENASGDAKMEMEQEYAELEGYRDDLDRRMDRVGANWEAGWNDFEGDVEQGWMDFKRESDELLNNVERSLDPEGDLE